jgi:hypothetical protein
MIALVPADGAEAKVSPKGDDTSSQIPAAVETDNLTLPAVRKLVKMT